MKIMKFFSAFGLILLIISASCSGGKTEISSNQMIPDDLINKGSKFISSATGQEFFENYISFNSSKTTRTAAGYLMVYDFKIPGKDFINEEISFMTDSSGKINEGKDIIGIPECLEYSCSFPVDEADAVRIAGENKFERGTGWKPDFGWDNNYKRYVWSVRSTITGGTGPNGFRGTGKVMFIDAQSGSVLGIKDWQVN